MKRTLPTLGAALASVALFTSACGGSSGGGSGSSLNASAGAKPASGTITIWARDSEKGFMSLLVDAYNKSHSVKATVTIIPAPNFVQKFGTASASGSGPDVAAIDLVYLPYFASKGVLEDISSVESSLPYKDGLSKAHMKLATYNGKQYALPFSAEASVMFWNKDLFKKAGLDPNKPPANFAEIRADAKKIRALGSDTYGFVMAGACGGCNVFETAPYIWASGGDILSQDGKKAELDSPQVTDTLTFLHGMWTDGSMPSLAKTDNGTGQAAAFQSGKVGIVNLGAFFVQTLNADKKVNFGVAGIPGKTGGTASFAGGDEIAVTKTAKNKTGAWDFVKWATSEEAQTILAKNSIVPVRTDLISKIYAPLDPRFKTLGDAMASGRTPYSVNENAMINDNNGPWAKLINQAVFGSGDIKADQASAQKSAQSILDNGGS